METGRRSFSPGGKDETGREKMVSGFFCFSFQSFTVAFSDHFISLSVVCVCCFDVKPKVKYMAFQTVFNLTSGCTQVDITWTLRYSVDRMFCLITHIHTLIIFIGL